MAICLPFSDPTTGRNDLRTAMRAHPPIWLNLTRESPRPVQIATVEPRVLIPGQLPESGAAPPRTSPPLPVPRELLGQGLTNPPVARAQASTANAHPRSDTCYLAHLERLARAKRPVSSSTRQVADLADRDDLTMRTDGRSPRYEVLDLQGAIFLSRSAPSSLAPSSRAPTTP